MTVSRGVAENASVAIGVAERRITIVRNPAFTKEIVGKGEAAPDHPWFQDGGPPVVLGVGRLEPRKDPFTLIEAFRHVLAERPCRLLILGEGPMRGELEGRVRSLGLEDRVARRPRCAL